MIPGYASLLGAGFLLGWSVAWPPGPINAEIARRSSSGHLGSAMALFGGAVSGDALWAVAAALGVGYLFSGPTTRLAMGVVSIALLLALSAMFFRGAWRAFSAEGGGEEAKAQRGGYWLGAAMALTSPWNVAFWLAAMGRPELAGADLVHLLTLAAGVIGGALTWSFCWAFATRALHGGLSGAAQRGWTIFVDAATGALMLYFAYGSATRLFGAQ